MCDDHSDKFTGIGFFNGTFSLEVKDDKKPYQVPLRHVAYGMQEPVKKELERQQQHQNLHTRNSKISNGATALL